MIPPKKQDCPNFKVDSFFRWLRHIWKQAWVLGKNCSVDEQTCKMQGKVSIKLAVGSSSGSGMDYNVIALPTMGSRMIFTSVTSQFQRSGLTLACARCMLIYYICLGDFLMLVTTLRWITCS